MTRNSRLAVLLSATLFGFIAAAPSAQAQPAPPPSGTPPATAGRLFALSGTVSFHTAEADQWQQATENYPVTSGDAFWTDPNARASIEVPGGQIALAGSTEIDIATLDPNTLSAIEPQGELYIHLVSLPPAGTVAFSTPRGTVQLLAPGRYDLLAGNANTPTEVNVIDGRASVSGAGVSLTVAGGQSAVVNGQNTFTAQLEPLSTSPFMAGELATTESPPVYNAPVTPPAAVAAMPGGSDLSSYGTWTDEAAYGVVWFPTVPVGWVPYRFGHWAYVWPWGWTWIDSDPWGFAPFHYGRWVDLDDRWAWVPVAVGAPVFVQPVFAPALVSFFHLGVAVGGVSVGITAGEFARGEIGWVPLGPGEVYVPPYRASPVYIRNVNITNVRNVTVINNVIRNVAVVNNVTIQKNITVRNFINRRAVTVVPATAMVRSRPVASLVQPVPPQLLAIARPVVSGPLMPTRATAGITPQLAERLHLPPSGALAPRPPAPGPRIEHWAVSSVPAGQPALPRPALRPPGVAFARPTATPLLHGPAMPPVLPPSAPLSLRSRESRIEEHPLASLQPPLRPLAVPGQAGVGSPVLHPATLPASRVPLPLHQGMATVSHSPLPYHPPAQMLPLPKLIAPSQVFHQPVSLPAFPVYHSPPQLSKKRILPQNQ